MPACDVAEPPARTDRSPATPNDAALADALRRDDPHALDAAYHAHAPSLLRLAAHLTGYAADAEDVVHDVFATLPAAMQRYDERGTLAGWLRTLVARRAVDRARADRRRREVPLAGADAACVALGALEHLSARDDAQRLTRAIVGLPTGLRAVFVLRAVEGWSHAEVAVALGIRIGTSEVRYFRAVRRLRAVLGDCT